MIGTLIKVSSIAGQFGAAHMVGRVVGAILPKNASLVTKVCYGCVSAYGAMALGDVVKKQADGLYDILFVIKEEDPIDVSSKEV